MRTSARSLNVSIGFLATVLLLAGACSDRALLPYDPDRTTVIGPDGVVEEADTPSGDECIRFADGPGRQCIAPQDECPPGAAADVIVDADGELVEIVCLPPEADYVAPVVDGEVPQNANNAVLTFDDADEVYEDDLAVDANNVVLYGDDPAEATLDGNLSIDGNNAIVRGITITGDVAVNLNDATFVYCVILGNVTIPANNTLITGCEIWGNVVIQGNNTQLRGNRIQGTVEVGGMNTVCEDNVSFVDEDEDGLVSLEELGGPVDC